MLNGYVLLLRIEHAGRMVEEQRLEPPEEPDQRRRQQSGAQPLFLVRHRAHIISKAATAVGT